MAVKKHDTALVKLKAFSREILYITFVVTFAHADAMTSCPMPSRDTKTFPNPFHRGEDGTAFITGFLSVLVTALLGWTAWQAFEEPLWGLVAMWFLIAAAPFFLRLLVTFLFAENDHPFVA